MKHVLFDSDAEISVLNGKIVAIVGYGNQGRSQVLCLRDSGIKTIIGATQGRKSYDLAKKEHFNVMSISEASNKGDIIHILLPDEVQGDIYNRYIKENIMAGKTISFSHGFSIVYKQIIPPKNVDVILISPRGPGSELRKNFENGTGVPGSIAVKQNYSGKARDIALAMAKGIGLTRKGVIECTFEQETVEDLFCEQNVLCGGLIALIKSAFETLVEAGYPEEMAYYGCVYELKLVVDLLQREGIMGFNEKISNTAEWGEYVTGPKIIDAKVKEKMRESLKRIEDGSFAQEWLKEYKKGLPNLLQKRSELSRHAIVETEKKIKEQISRLSKLSQTN